MSKLKILMSTTELSGLASVGGLGQVVTSLTSALKQAGHDLRIALPYYNFITHAENIIGPKLVWSGKLHFGKMPDFEVYKTSLQTQDVDLFIYLIKGHRSFDEVDSPEHLYCRDDQPEPYFFFAASLLEFLNNTKTWTPDIIHAHDYHTGIISIYLNNNYHSVLNEQPVASVLTIHNLRFQGITDTGILTRVGLDPQLGYYSPDLHGMEFYGKINSMKGALINSNIVSTVSKTYAEEILHPEQGMGLDGVLRIICKKNRLKYILNGIDKDVWDPAQLYGELAYDASNLAGKKISKRTLQKECGLDDSDHPIILIRSRWCYQKGIEVILHTLRKYGFYKFAQLLVISRITDDDPVYRGLWYELKGWAHSYPNRISFMEDHKTFAQLQYSGSDMLLMPSLYEPCGLVALEAMQYGTIPIVHKTGGLSDIVTPDVGFVFNWPVKEPLLKSDMLKGADIIMEAIEEAIDTYYHPGEWEKLVQNSMTRKHDWTIRIPEYEALYFQAITHAEMKQILPFH